MFVMKVILNTGSTIKQGAVIKGGKKMTDKYKEEAAVCHVNPNDFRNLLLRSDKELKRVKVKTRCGEVVVNVKVDDRIAEGHIFIPRGPWANRVIDAYTFDSGSPFYKGMDAEIMPTDEDVMDCRELIMEYKEYKNKNKKK